MWQLCQASAPIALMPASTLTWRRRGTAIKAPAGTIPARFIGTWTACGMSRLWASVKTLLRMEKSEAVPKNDGELRVLLQHLPHRVIEIGLHCGVYEVQRASKDIEVSHRGWTVHYVVFQVLQSVIFGNARGHLLTGSLSLDQRQKTPTTNVGRVSFVLR